jgi:hypothetical protein
MDATVSEEARTTMFEKALCDILNSMGVYRGPLPCGEMGYELSCLEPEFGIRLTDTTIKAIENRHSSWCLWCYKDAHFMGLTYPDENSGWMRLVKAVRLNWDHHRASRLGMDAVNAVEKLCPYPMSDEEKYRMKFVIRAMAAHTDVEHILKPALDALPVEQRNDLPEDFQFSRCEKNVLLETLLKSSCGQSACL